jgi:hypothetical protein
LSTSQAVATLSISNATLTFDGWATVLSATTVTLENQGRLTLPSAFTTSQMSNRVYVICKDMTIKPGGAIQADAKGYAGSYQPNIGNGQGGGTGGNMGGGGGGHGGGGGIGRAYSTDKAGGSICGVSNAPVMPGSGGGGGWNGPGGAGGGVVRIDASGAIVQDGTISANGESRDTVGFPGGGAGGSIFVNCAAFSGSGTNRANGGAAWAYGSDQAGGGGGGGRIAVWIGLTEGQKDNALANDLARLIVADSYRGFSGTNSVAPGTGYLNLPTAGSAGSGSMVVITPNVQGTIFVLH